MPRAATCPQYKKRLWKHPKKVNSQPRSYSRLESEKTVVRDREVHCFNVWIVSLFVSFFIYAKCLKVICTVF